MDPLLSRDSANSLHNCRICPRNCGTNRFIKKGVCRSDEKVKLNLYQLHHWEEPVISGNKGSGTIFFSNCNLNCVFCQNYTISQEGRGKNITISELCSIMLELQEKGAHNINLVSPMHYSLQIRDALVRAKVQGLQIPVIWNSNAYETPETLKKLEGLVDIYLPDFKYSVNTYAQKYSMAGNYFENAKASVLEMYRQTGHLRVFEGIAFRGVLIRILVLPGQTENVAGILRWIADTLGTQCNISLLGQYYPAYKSANYPEIMHGLSKAEYLKAVKIMDELGFSNGYLQEVGSSDAFTPDFINE